MATEGDTRSISSGISFPMWMKNRMADRLDFEQSAFSPPENDDNFFYIRYPRATSEPKTTVNESKLSLTKATETFITKPVLGASNINHDFSKHTSSCQKFLTDLNNIPQKPLNLPPDTKIKSNGTDDGFKGEAAACGSSVIRVASQMVSSKVTRGFQIEEGNSDGPPKGFNPNARRGSKSLPASPLGSPNTSPKSRKRLQNKYFTSAFTDGENYQGGWLLSNLLSKREAISKSVSTINEEVSHEETLSKCVSNLSIDEPPVTVAKPSAKTFKPKPSELREMNFWSPTSM